MSAWGTAATAKKHRRRPVGRRRRREWIAFPGLGDPPPSAALKPTSTQPQQPKTTQTTGGGGGGGGEEEERHETVPGGVFGDLELHGGTNGPWGAMDSTEDQEEEEEEVWTRHVADGTESRPTRGGGTRGAPSG